MSFFWRVHRCSWTPRPHHPTPTPTTTIATREVTLKTRRFIQPLVLWDHQVLCVDLHSSTTTEASDLCCVRVTPPVLLEGGRGAVGSTSTCCATGGHTVCPYTEGGLFFFLRMLLISNVDIRTHTHTLQPPTPSKALTGHYAGERFTLYTSYVHYVYMCLLARMRSRIGKKKTWNQDQRTNCRDSATHWKYKKMQNEWEEIGACPNCLACLQNLSRTLQPSLPPH